MKNAITGLMFILFLLPAVSFGANQGTVVDPQQQAFIQQQDQEARAYYAQLAQERAQYIKTHAAFVAKLDVYGRAKAAYDAAVRAGKAAGMTPPTPPSDPEYANYLANMQAGAADHQTFLGKLSQERAQFQKGRSGNITADTGSSNNTPSNNTPTNNTPSNNTPPNNTPSNNTPSNNTPSGGGTAK